MRIDLKILITFDILLMKCDGFEVDTVPFHHHAPHLKNSKIVTTFSQDFAQVTINDAKSFFVMVQEEVKKTAEIHSIRCLRITIFQPLLPRLTRIYEGRRQ